MASQFELSYGVYVRKVMFSKDLLLSGILLSCSLMVGLLKEAGTSTTGTTVMETIPSEQNSDSDKSPFFRIVRDSVSEGAIYNLL